MADWAYALGQPFFFGKIKVEPQDFVVLEQMPVIPSGEGEHVWLKLRKVKTNTEQLAKQLAKHANVPYRSVSYSGRKDYQAVTEQWFSVWMPGVTDPDWSALNSDQITLLEHSRHDRKLRLATHNANQFKIRVRDINGDRDKLEERWQNLIQHGVPNYFGEQRFGRNASNLDKAEALLSGQIKVRDRAQRSLLLSSARSWLFNECLSARVEQKSWLHLHFGEPVLLDGSASFFKAGDSSSEDAELASRLQTGDIHPSSPLWGDVKDTQVCDFKLLHKQEKAIIERYPALMEGLKAARLGYDRRATRSLPKDATMSFDDSDLLVEFSLPSGQFATSVLRELITQI